MGESQGVLPSQEIRKLIEEGFIKSDSGIGEDSIQPASLDLTLGRYVHRINASAIPGGRPQTDILSNSMHTYDLRAGPVFLEHDVTYLAELNEKLKLPRDIRVYANSKSSTGRDDIFVRLIAPCAQWYDALPSGFKGKLFLEIIPQAFPILLKEEGVSFNQIRFFRGDTDFGENAIRVVNSLEPLVYRSDGTSIGEEITLHNLGTGKTGIVLHLDLGYGRSKDTLIGYKTKRVVNAPIPISKKRKIPDREKLDPKQFFEPIFAPSDGKIVLEPETMYILSTEEYSLVPPHLCATLATQESTLGEVRSHYAGFFDPGWGMAHKLKGEKLVTIRNKSRGTPATLEVRVMGRHSIIYKHGQQVCKAIYDVMAKEPDKVYGLVKDGKSSSNYNDQRGPKLSKRFRDWY